MNFLQPPEGGILKNAEMDDEQRLVAALLSLLWLLSKYCGFLNRLQ